MFEVRRTAWNSDAHAEWVSSPRGRWLPSSSPSPLVGRRSLAAPRARPREARGASSEREDVMLSAGKKLAVFSIRESRGGSLWVRAGSAFVNRDGSLNVL